MSDNFSVHGGFLSCGLPWVDLLWRHLTLKVSAGRSWFLFCCCSRDPWQVPQPLLLLEIAVRWGILTGWGREFGMKSGSKKHLCWGPLSLLCCGGARANAFWSGEEMRLVTFQGVKDYGFFPSFVRGIFNWENVIWIADQGGKYESRLQTVVSVATLLKMLGTDLSNPRTRCCDLAQWRSWRRAMSCLWRSWGLLLSVEGAWDSTKA